MIIPKSLEAINAQDQIESSTTGWNDVPPVTRHYIDKPAILLQPTRIPQKDGNQAISIDFNSMASLGDVMTVISGHGVPSIISDKGLSDQMLSINSFDGSVKQLVNAISKSMDVAFDWSDGVLLVGKTSNYMLSMTQDEGMLSKLGTEITKLGAEKVSTSIPTGTIAFSSSDRNQLIIDRYINRAIKNSATINLQIAVISITLNNNRTTGIDWSNLAATFRGGIPVAAPASTTATAGGVAGVTAVAATATQAAVEVVKGFKAGVVGGTGVGLALDSGDFSMKTLLSALSTYGNVKTDQNLLLKTLSGNKVKIKSGTTVPYVSGVTAVLGGGMSGNGSSGNGALGGSQTAKAESGITVEVTPNYDADTNVVTLGVELTLSSITGFVELKAGAQLGSLTQPSTQDQSFNDVAKLQAGDTILLGGLILDNSEDKRTSLVPIESFPMGGDASKNRREALFIVIRPTSDVYEFSDTTLDDATFKVNKKGM